MGTLVNKAPPDGNPAFPAYQVLTSANTPDFPPSQWVINSPQLRPLVGTGTIDNPQTPKRYWIVSPPSSQNLREMTAPEKAVVDGNASEVASARTVQVQFLRQQVNDYLASRYEPHLQHVYQQLVVRATAARLTNLQAWFDWLTTIYSATKVAEQAVAAAATVPAVQAISVNYAATFNATDPLTRFTSVVP